MLKVKIKKQLENIVLDIDFETNDAVLGLIGASGSGKSMTLKCIAGIERPDSGFISLDDRVLYDSEKKINLRPQDRNIGYLFQNFALFPQMTVKKNIYVSVNKKYDKNEKDKKINEIIELLNLKGLENKLQSEISGGQQQRVSIARALAGKPSLLLADEPTGALDSKTSNDVLNFLKQLHSEGNTIVMITHDNSIALEAKRVVRIHDGKIIFDGDTEEYASKFQTSN